DRVQAIAGCEPVLQGSGVRFEGGPERAVAAPERGGRGGRMDALTAVVDPVAAPAEAHAGQVVREVIGEPRPDDRRQVSDVEAVEPDAWLLAARGGHVGAHIQLGGGAKPAYQPFG